MNSYENEDRRPAAQDTIGKIKEASEQLEQQIDIALQEAMRPVVDGIEGIVQSPAFGSVLEQIRETEMAIMSGYQQAAFADIAERFAGAFRGYLLNQLHEKASIAGVEKPSFFDFPYSSLKEHMTIGGVLRDTLLAEGDEDCTDALKEEAGINYEAWKAAIKRIPDDFRTVRNNPIRNKDGRVFAWSESASSPNLADLQEWCDKKRLLLYVDEEDLSSRLLEDETKQAKLDESSPADQYRMLCGLCAIGFEEAIRKLVRPPKLLALQDVKPVTTHVSATSLVAQRAYDAQRDALEETPLELCVIPERKVITKVAIGYDGMNVQGLEQLSPFDRSVLDGVCTLIEAGNMIISPAQICRTMTGAEKPSQRQVDEVEASVDKQMGYLVTIDCTDELIARGIKGYFASDTTNCIEARKRLIQSPNGQEFLGYIIKDVPIIYAYSKRIEQVASFPQKLLKAGNLQNTDNNILIRDYMLRRIDGMKKMKSNNLKSRRVKYSTVWRDGMGHASAFTKTEKNRLKRTVGDFLSGLVSEHHIKGFEEYMIGRKCEGVEISI